MFGTPETGGIPTSVFLIHGTPLNTPILLLGIKSTPCILVLIHCASFQAQCGLHKTVLNSALRVSPCTKSSHWGDSHDCACVLSQQFNPRSYDTRNRSRNGSMSVWTVKVFSEPFQIRTAKDVFSERFWGWIRSWITNFFCVWTQLSPGTVPVDWIEHG